MSAEFPNEMEALDIEDVASLLGVSERMVRNYINDNDLPCRGDGRGRRFIWSEVREWYVAYRIEKDGSRRNGLTPAEFSPQIPTSETFTEATLRKVKAEADLLEVKLAKERGLVVAVADVQRNVSKVAVAIKTAVLAMPDKLTDQLFGLKDKKRLRSILERETSDICRKLMDVGTAEETEETGDE